MDRVRYTYAPWKTSAGTRLFLLVALAATLACNSNNPVAPSPGGDGPPAAATYSLRGTVTADGGGMIASAEVRVKAGANTGQRATTDGNGQFTLANLQPGEMTVEATASGCLAQATTIALAGDQSVNFTLPRETTNTPDPPPTPEPPPPAPRFRIVGAVFVSSLTPKVGIEDARIVVASGANAGASATSGPDGRYVLDNLLGGDITIEASAPGYVAQSSSFALTGDRTNDFDLTARFVTSGRVLNAITRTGLADVDIEGEELLGQRSGADGSFRLTASGESSSPRLVTFKGLNIVERQVRMRVPGPNAEVTVIPGEFDLHAFNEMFRSPMLYRWTQAPPLHVEQRTVQFSDVNMVEGTGIADAMTDSEASGLVNDLTWALGPLTGGTYTAFANVMRQTSATGATIRLLNPGVITVVRVAGLTTATGSWGYGRWLYSSDGVVTGGVILLDRDFDRSGSQFTRSLRAHELGHALGYQHVTGRQSVMNAAARVEPTAFDRDAARLAFQRQPGNRSPDIDPAPVSVNRAEARWSPAIE